MGVKSGILECKLPAVRMYAVLIVSPESEFQALVTALKEVCVNNGLSLNDSKTKILIFERNEEKVE